MTRFARISREECDAFQHTNLRSLVDYCILTIARKVDVIRTLFSALSHHSSVVMLPDELLSKIIQLMIKRRKINDENLDFLLHSYVRILDLTNSQTANIPLIGNKCPNLSILCLRGCLSVSDASLLQLSTHCHNLTGLSLMYNKKITDKGVSQLVRTCTKLQQLDLSWCWRITDTSLDAISSNCTFLEELSVANCKNISGSGLMGVINQCSKLKRLELRSTPIRQVDFTSSSLIELDVCNCLNLEDDSMSSLEFCPQLRLLSCSSCSKLTDSGLLNLLRSSAILSLDLSHCNFQSLAFFAPNLALLKLDGCRFLSNHTFENLGIHCSSLTEISLRGCETVTDECIDYLTKHNPGSLNFIDFSRCEKLTDEAIHFIVQRCSSLVYLDFSWCTLLTDMSLMYVSRHLHKIPQFEIVKAFGCNFSGEAIHQLRRRIKQTNSKLLLQCIMNERDWSTLAII